MLLVYPSTIDEYWEAIDALDRPAAPTADGGPDPRSERRPGHGPCYVVTTAGQRDRWGLPDLGASRRARVVDERQVFDLLREGAAGPAAARDPLPGAVAEAPPREHDGGTGGSALAAVRALVTPGARIDQVLGALESASSSVSRRSTARAGGAVEPREAVSMFAPWHLLGVTPAAG